ncbi:alpha/beta hydrolase [Candidatus Pelagibacter sp.]|jgi:phospholipase/carboxylesterase|nr:alpha/beta hydrolase [Candidatus Pelagibacter sp.]
MTFCLESTLIQPENNVKIQSAVILLHGYGGDGKDISMLSLNWKRHLPNTIFICPNGHEKCPINPSGYQWFDLTKENPEYILSETKKAEKKLNVFIQEVKKKFNLENNRICLSGFSQGCMMSINLGLISDQEYGCIVGFSGKIINQEDLRSRKKVSTPTLLIHGDSDQVVSPNFMLEAKDFFIRNNIEIKTHLIENCDHHIPIEASSIALNYLKKNLMFTKY